MNEPTKLPPGCVLGNLRRGNGPRASWVYAQILGPDGTVLVQGPIEYCVRRMVDDVLGEVPR